MRRALGEPVPFGVVLIDSTMPDMDGFALAQRIRQEPGLASSHLILMSSGLQRGEEELCRSLGIVQCVAKPVKQSQLLDAILDVVGIGLEHTPDRRSPKEAERVAGRVLHILVAEDNPVNQKLAVSLLEKRGHVVTVVDNGQLAVDALEHGTFDLVLMDVQMPVLGGLEATRVIRERERERGGHVPIIAMTARAMTGDREGCLAAGMDAYVSKPIRRDVLFSEIEATTSPRHEAPAADESSTASDGEANGIAAVDREALFELLSDDRELLRDLVELYAADAQDRLESIAEAVGRADGRALVEAAHALTGASGNLRVAVVLESARRLEDMGRSGELQDAAQELVVLQRELPRALAALQSIVDERR
jgi:CheY-like chemotaxis protein